METPTEGMHVLLDTAEDSEGDTMAPPGVCSEGWHGWNNHARQTPTQILRRRTRPTTADIAARCWKDSSGEHPWAVLEPRNASTPPIFRASPAANILGERSTRGKNAPLDRQKAMLLPPYLSPPASASSGELKGSKASPEAGMEYRRGPLTAPYTPRDPGVAIGFR